MNQEYSKVLEELTTSIKQSNNIQQKKLHAEKLIMLLSSIENELKTTKNGINLKVIQEEIPLNSFFIQYIIFSPIFSEIVSFEEEFDVFSINNVLFAPWLIVYSKIILYFNSKSTYKNNEAIKNKVESSFWFLVEKVRKKNFLEKLRELFFCEKKKDKNLYSAILAILYRLVQLGYQNDVFNNFISGVSKKIFLFYCEYSFIVVCCLQKLSFSFTQKIIFNNLELIDVKNFMRQPMLFIFWISFFYMKILKQKRNFLHLFVQKSNVINDLVKIYSSLKISEKDHLIYLSFTHKILLELVKRKLFLKEIINSITRTNFSGSNRFINDLLIKIFRKDKKMIYYYTQRTKVVIFERKYQFISDFHLEKLNFYNNVVKIDLIYEKNNENLPKRMREVLFTRIFEEIHSFYNQNHSIFITNRKTTNTMVKLSFINLLINLFKRFKRFLKMKNNSKSSKQILELLQVYFPIHPKLFIQIINKEFLNPYRPFNVYANEHLIHEDYLFSRVLKVIRYYQRFFGNFFRFFGKFSVISMLHRKFLDVSGIMAYQVQKIVQKIPIDFNDLFENIELLRIVVTVSVCCNNSTFKNEFFIPLFYSSGLFSFEYEIYVVLVNLNIKNINFFINCVMKSRQLLHLKNKNEFGVLIKCLVNQNENTEFIINILMCLSIVYETSFNEFVKKLQKTTNISSGVTDEMIKRQNRKIIRLVESKKFFPQQFSRNNETLLNYLQKFPPEVLFNYFYKIVQSCEHIRNFSPVVSIFIKFFNISFFNYLEDKKTEKNVLVFTKIPFIVVLRHFLISNNLSKLVVNPFVNYCLFLSLEKENDVFIIERIIVSILNNLQWIIESKVNTGLFFKLIRKSIVILLQKNCENCVPLVMIVNFVKNYFFNEKFDVQLTNDILGMLGTIFEQFNLNEDKYYSLFEKLLQILDKNCVKIDQNYFVFLESFKIVVKCLPVIFTVQLVNKIINYNLVNLILCLVETKDDFILSLLINSEKFNKFLTRINQKNDIENVILFEILIYFVTTTSKFVDFTINFPEKRLIMLMNKSIFQINCCELVSLIFLSQNVVVFNSSIVESHLLTILDSNDINFNILLMFGMFYGYKSNCLFKWNIVLKILKFFLQSYKKENIQISLFCLKKIVGCSNDTTIEMIISVCENFKSTVRSVVTNKIIVLSEIMKTKPLVKREIVQNAILLLCFNVLKKRKFSFLVVNNALKTVVEDKNFIKFNLNVVKQFVSWLIRNSEQFPVFLNVLIDVLKTKLDQKFYFNFLTMFVNTKLFQSCSTNSNWSIIYTFLSDYPTKVENQKFYSSLIGNLELSSKTVKLNVNKVRLDLLKILKILLQKINDISKFAFLLKDTLLKLYTATLSDTDLVLFDIFSIYEVKGVNIYSNLYQFNNHSFNGTKSVDIFMQFYQNKIENLINCFPLALELYSNNELSKKQIEMSVVNISREKIIDHRFLLRYVMFRMKTGYFQFKYFELYYFPIACKAISSVCKHTRILGYEIFHDILKNSNEFLLFWSKSKRGGAVVQNPAVFSFFTILSNVKKLFKFNNKNNYIKMNSIFMHLFVDLFFICKNYKKKSEILKFYVLKVSSTCKELYYCDEFVQKFVFGCSFYYFDIKILFKRFRNLNKTPLEVLCQKFQQKLTDSSVVIEIIGVFEKIFKNCKIVVQHENEVFLILNSLLFRLKLRNNIIVIKKILSLVLSLLTTEFISNSRINFIIQKIGMNFSEIKERLTVMVMLLRKVLFSSYKSDNFGISFNLGSLKLEKTFKRNKKKVVEFFILFFMVKSRKFSQKLTYKDSVTDLFYYFDFFLKKLKKYFLQEKMNDKPLFISLISSFYYSIKTLYLMDIKLINTKVVKYNILNVYMLYKSFCFEFVYNELDKILYIVSNFLENKLVLQLPTAYVIDGVNAKCVNVNRIEVLKYFNNSKKRKLNNDNEDNESRNTKKVKQW